MNLSSVCCTEWLMIFLRHTGSTNWFRTLWERGEASECSGSLSSVNSIVTSCSRRFGEIYCLDLKERRWRLHVNPKRRYICIRLHGVTYQPTALSFVVYWLCICYFDQIFRLQVSLKSDNNNEYFTWRCFHIYDDSLNSSYNEKCFK